MKQYIPIRSLKAYTILALLLLQFQPVVAFSAEDAFGSINDAVVKLVQFCREPKVGLDEKAAATLVDYVLAAKQNKGYALPKSQGCTGVYFEFDTKVTFPRFMEYAYNPLIPSAITRPSSLRYSVWTALTGGAQKLPNRWEPVSPIRPPVVIHGTQHDSNTPDLTTGAYYEYDLRRTLILLNHKGRQALVSVSKQISPSNVGKKGVILGNDSDWSYYYSGIPGCSLSGLGWVKSYIYDYFSIVVYAEADGAPAMVRSGIFQWLNAGWLGVNFVKSSDILGGMKRLSRDCEMILGSPRLPTPSQIISVHQRLSNIPAGDLLRDYAALQHAQRSSAIRLGKIGKSEGEEQVSFADTPKEQMVEELMLEYLKMKLGKPTVFGTQSLF